MGNVPILISAVTLDNPRGLAFGPGGFLYVVEAGTGGTNTLCLPPVDPGAPPRCHGDSGAITRVVGLGDHQRVVTGLPSAAGPTGKKATGVHDNAFGFGAAFLTIGLGGDPAAFEADGVHFGRLIRIDLTGQRTNVLDLADYEATANPDGGLVDSNPYALLLRAGGGVFTDAGGNSLVNTTPTGVMSTLAVFPTRLMPNPFGPGQIPMQSACAGQERPADRGCRRLYQHH